MISPVLIKPMSFCLEKMLPQKLPKKGNFRQRAHSNPLSDNDLPYPLNPSVFQWQTLFPDILDRKVDILDIGCGYGGLLVGLSPIFPDSFILGFEIRQKVVEYVEKRISALRSHQKSYSNIAVYRSNAMKHLLNFIEKGQISKLFILFPDPHFKKKKHKARIISSSLLSEYAYLLKKGGRFYIATDVPDLFGWMNSCLQAFPLFKLVLDVSNDPCVNIMINQTEESLKVAREGRDKFFAVYEKI
jgi:tRNA (guanine-N7-)-methyltransferase